MPSSRLQSSRSCTPDAPINIPTTHGRQPHGVAAKPIAPMLAKTMPATEMPFGVTRRAASAEASDFAQRVSRDLRGRRDSVMKARTLMKNTLAVQAACVFQVRVA